MAVLRSTRQIPQQYLRPLPGESDELFRAEFLGEVSAFTGAIIQAQEKQVQDSAAVQLITGAAASSQEIQEQDISALNFFSASGEQDQEPQESQGAAVLAFPGIAEHNQEPQDQDGTAYNGILILGAAVHAQGPQGSTASGDVIANDQPVLIPVYRARQAVTGKINERQGAQDQDAAGNNANPVGGYAIHEQGPGTAKGKAIFGFSGKAEHKQRPINYSMEVRVVSAEDELIEILLMMEAA